MRRWWRFIAAAAPGRARHPRSRSARSGSGTVHADGYHGESTPEGIDCGAKCSATYESGTSVTLTAAAADGFRFSEWSGGCSGASPSCIVTLTAATEVTASFAAIQAGNTCTQVTQYGVTFSFDKAYPCGTFANGDFWVSPEGASRAVTVTSITPAFTVEGDDYETARNGFEVNPDNPEKQGFDGRAFNFDIGRVPALPYAAHAADSIVKAVSLEEGDKTVLETAVVLTVLAKAPADNGASVFRPPYFGKDKPLYSTASLRLDTLPRLDPVDGAPPLAEIEERYRRVQLDHQVYWYGDYIHPLLNMPDYGAAIATDNAAAALRLMLDDDTQQKLPAAIRYVQYGIDLAAAVRGGTHFIADGGHRHGRKLVLALAAFLLDDAAMAALVHDAPYDTYQEDGDLYYSEKAGMVLWGKRCSESDYWDNQNTGANSRDCRDPYGYIDGGQEPGGYYQFCCTAMGFKATALALRLMPQLQCIWNNDDLLAYADRWVTHGAWTQPDPYAPHGNGAPDNNPVDGTGRWPDLHGAGKDDGYYGSDFADAMWSEYRASAPASPDCSGTSG